MKKFKNILLSIALVFAICVPLTLAGCAKHYTVNVSIVGAGGSVMAVGETKNLTGENDVTEGENFEFNVIPDAHYKVSYIKVDGDYIYNINSTSNTLVPNGMGEVKPCLFNVSANSNVEVAFVANTYTMSFYYLDGGDYVQLRNIDGTPVLVQAQYGTNVTIEGMTNFEFKYSTANSEIKNDWNSQDTFSFNQDLKLYSETSTKEQLIELLVDFLDPSTMA